MRRATHLAGIRATRLAAILLFVAAAGCTKARLAQSRPHASVTPLSLDFGQTPILFPVARPLLVANGGTVALHVTNVRVEGAAASAFAVAARPFEVLGGGTAQLIVTFRPPAQQAFSATLRFDTDDPDEPSFDVALTGTGGAAGAIAVRPAALEFGRVGEGRTAVQQLSIASLGPADLFLASLGFSADTPKDYALLGSTATPATLPAGQSVQIAVRYSPTQGAASATGTLVIGSSDPTQPSVSVPLHASLNRAPIPSATGQVGTNPPQSTSLDTAVGATVMLDASGSTDPDGDLPLRYRWTLASLPPGSAAKIADPLAARTTITLDVAGSYPVLLTATDATGLDSTAPARLDLRALPPEQLLVQLVWDQVPPDLDLHLLRSPNAGGTSDDCSWSNPDPSWFAGGPDANPHHLGDALVGYGPETVRWKTPADGTYTLAVVYKQGHGAANPATNAQVRVYAFGVEIADLRHAFTQVGEVWTAGTVEWPTAKVVPAQAREGGPAPAESAQ